MIDQTTVFAVGVLVLMNLGGLLSFFLALDRRLTRLETRQESCPFHQPGGSNGACDQGRRSLH